MKGAGISIALACATFALAHPQPAWAAHEPGPCRQKQVASVVDRPSTGSAPATSGSPCTVDPGHVVVEYGYRNEIDVGPPGSSNLGSFPMSLLRFGYKHFNEFILLPPNMALRGGYAGPGYTPAIGSQDGGFGWKHELHDHNWFQDAIEVFVTIPTGTHGYSAGVPTYSLSYAAGFSLSDRLGVTANMGVVDGPGTTAIGTTSRFVSYEPSITLSYAVTPQSTLFINDNVAVAAEASGGTSNTLLAGFQYALSPGTVLDIETDYNLTPTAHYRERAIGFGGAFYL